MATDFVLKKNFTKIFISGLICLFAFIIGYVCVLIRTVTLPINKSFYFLVSASTHIQASTHFVSMNGGAGYLLNENDRTYVVYAVYLEKQHAARVQANLSDKTELKEYTIDNIYLRNQKAWPIVQEAFNVFYGWLTILEYEINRLAKGCTQQSSKQILQTLQRQMEYSAKKNEKIFPVFSQLCTKGEQFLLEITQGIIYATDLRYLLCELCIAYCNFANCVEKGTVIKYF